MKTAINWAGVSFFAGKDARPWRAFCLAWNGTFCYCLNYRDARGMHMWTFSPWIRPIWTHQIFGRQL